jgi:hypothetical protein
MVLGVFLAAPVEHPSNHFVSRISDIRYRQRYLGHVSFDNLEDVSIVYAIEEDSLLIEYMLPEDVQRYLHELATTRQRMLIRDTLEYIGTYCREERSEPSRELTGCEAALHYTLRVCNYEECTCRIPN